MVRNFFVGIYKEETIGQVSTTVTPNTNYVNSNNFAMTKNRLYLTSSRIHFLGFLSNGRGLLMLARKHNPDLSFLPYRAYRNHSKKTDLWFLFERNSFVVIFCLSCIDFSHIYTKRLICYYVIREFVNTEAIYMKTYGPYKLQHTYNVVTVPWEVRRKLGVEAGDLVVWVIDDEGRCLLKKVTIKIE